MAQVIAKFLSANVVQGSADAFVQDTVPTNLIPSDGFAFKLKHIMFDRTSANLVASGDISFSLTRDTKTAVVKYDDPDTIFFHTELIKMTTSGAIVSPGSGVITFPDGIFVVEPNIYLQLDSTATTVVNSMNARIYYEEVKISEVEILRILNNV